MALVVEDGTALSNSNSYASEDTLDTYCDDRGIVLADGDAEAALVRASQWIDSTYRFQFSGIRVKLRAQAMEWPRVGVIDGSGFYVAFDQIPTEIVKATCEAAIRELAEPGSLAPDLDRGGAIKAIQAGTARIDYGANAAPQTVFQIIDGILAGLIGASSPYSVRAVR
jgi:hypothetical protein